LFLSGNLSHQVILSWQNNKDLALPYEALGLLLL
jgi:hypothetical protein